MMAECPYYYYNKYRKAHLDHFQHLCTLTGLTCLVYPPDGANCLRRAVADESRTDPDDHIRKIPTIAKQGQLL
jgi:hypothetical protein